MMRFARYRHPKMADKLVDSKTGVIKTCSGLMRGAHEPKFFIDLTEISGTQRVMPFLGGISSTGVGLTAEDAANAALGEALEDYCFSIVPDDLPLSTWRNLTRAGHSALHPEEYPLFSARQYAQVNFPFAPFTKDTPLRWVKARSFPEGTEKLVPAGLVYGSYQPLEQELRICPTNYTGTGCGGSMDQALLASLCEVIERDAMMIWWLNQLPFPRSRPRPDSWFKQILEERFEFSGLCLELWEITTDIGIPCFFGLLTDPFHQITSGGFSCRLSPEQAAFKALYECLQNRLGVLSLQDGSGVREVNARLGQKVLNYSLAEQYTCAETEGFATMSQLNMNLQFYADPDNFRYLDTVRSNQDEIIFPRPGHRPFDVGPAEQLAAYIDALQRKGLEILVVDITLPDIADLGFFVIRALVPGLVPNSVTAWPYLGNPRLYTVPEYLGFKGKKEPQLETAPMPYG